MRKSLFIIALISILFALLAFFVFYYFHSRISQPRYSKQGNRISLLYVNDQKLEVEIVDASDKRALGLSGRTELCANCGMFFVFPEKSQYSFWMKDMLFDLDIVWISGDKIVYIAKNVSHEKGASESINPPSEADKVLEISSGQSDTLGLRPGDTIIAK